MKFNEKLVRLRKGHGYTQEQLAEKLEVTRQAVSRWESGDTTPEMALLVRLCEVFGVTADYLINDSIENEGDIPIIKKKDEEMKRKDEEIISAALEKKHLFLFSAICFTVGAVCSLIGIAGPTTDAQLTLFSINLAFSTCLSIFQFVRYFMSK